MATTQENNLQSVDHLEESEVKDLAENMLKHIEDGELTRAVSLVNDLTDVRDRTLYQEIGKLTRALHDAIRNLKVNDVGAGSEIENTSDKLEYVMQMTDKSANKTMDLVDSSIPIAADIQSRSVELSQKWQRFLKKELKPDEFRSLSKLIQEFLNDSVSQSEKLQSQLSDIMMAQDFQDLTGQVIRKVSDLVRDVERRLVDLVVMAGQVDSITGIQHDHGEEDQPDNASPEGDITPEGPQIDPTKPDVATSQDDVDDLLSSLGF